MKKLKIFVFSLLSLILVFLCNYRVAILTLTTANLVALVSQAKTYTDAATPEQQTQNAVQPMNNTSFGLMDSVSGLAGYLGGRSEESKGLQLKTPVVAPGFTYRWSSDDAVGGFAGDELSGGVAADADVYDGLIAGILYQRTYRGTQNLFGTSEHLDSNGVSVYGAKRFFNLLNVGLAYNFSDTEHRLTRAINVDLDRSSNGFSMFAGLSDHKGKWGWSTTTSFGFVRDDYRSQKDLDTGRFGWGGSLGYDITKLFTLSGAFSYYNYVIQDLFPNGSVRDDDYYTLGPRLTFYPKDNLTVHLDFDSMQGYKDLASYALRLGVDIGF